MTDSQPQLVDVLVIGAGQAGLSAAFHLQRRGLVPAAGERVGVRAGAESADPQSDRGGLPRGDRLSYLVLDAEEGPGGAWQHRWRSLRMATVNGISSLPGVQTPEVDPAEPSSEFITRYFDDYEQQLELAIRRPVHVRRVSREDDDPHGRLRVESSAGSWSTRALINATGTWTKPFWPLYPGQQTFEGRQLHVADFVSAQEFANQHVAVVGGGISAVQLLDEISQVTSTSWFTRREPVWRDSAFDAGAGRDAVAMVEERVARGLPPLSVVSVTGLLWTPALREAAARGALERRPMFLEMVPDGVRLVDGSVLPVDVILWATGFRAALDHLAPLRLRGHGGGIAMEGTRVADEPRVHLVGYGPSSSTIGANRAGRAAVNDLVALLTEP
ncbi:NAD(P)-binding domain-containing protein [Ornithinimicrobium cryptoxanthini]|uniref:NAD(P)/FAD-dependent oxidoreductase n=1 Tax=Ornithinimicrobium cryptoxanthini TaxID=2934161 RepID=A0ABY4YJB8_9MICO|nr:NAD(P)-binding domain-containing protein [Ornithinimicrobium cryptoxanthini]USQ76428.1 NAD(P)/FAD-dependent oxidoreductase [Ornithinimicrobium cryptoxanthini]